MSARREALLRAAISVLLGSAPALTARAATQAAFYVDPIRGRDDSDGSSMSRAFRTIEAARNAVRAINGSMTGDIYVFLAGGVYPQTKTLTFNQYDSGTNQYSVIYRDYDGLPAVISGGQSITGWTLHAHGIYRASGVDFDFRQLWVNGARATRARKTLAEINRTSPLVQLPGSEGYRTRDLAWLGYGRPGQVEFVYHTNNRGELSYVNRRALVSSVERSGNQAVIRMRDLYRAMTSASQPWLAVGLPSWVENAYEFLDQPGEWYLDRTSHQLFYQPSPGQNMRSVVVIAPRVETLVEVRPGILLEQRVSHLKFEGLTFAYANGWMGIDSEGGMNDHQADMTTAGGKLSALPGNVRVESADNVGFEHCQFTHLGGEGLEIAYARDTTVNRCAFSDITGTGIQVLGHADDPVIADQRKVTKNTLIRNSQVTDCGVERWGAVGIFLGYVQGTTLVNNELSHLPYSGISSGWGWGAADSPHSKGTSIAHNHVHDVMGRLRDGGMVYTLGSHPGSTLVGNYLENQTPGADNSVGIYWDSGTTGFSAYRNVVKNINRPHRLWLVVNAPSRGLSVQESYLHPGQGSCVFEGGACVAPRPDKLVLAQSHEEFPWSTTALSIIRHAGLQQAGAALGRSHNQAQDERATASSWSSGEFAPERANDGDIYRGWASGPSDPRPYWDVDLGAPFLIEEIELLARQDVDQPVCRRNFEVLAGNSSDFAKDRVAVGSQGPNPFPHRALWRARLSGERAYRYLRVRKNVADEALSIAEFRARGLPLATNNLAAGKPAVASSQRGPGFEASRAVDRGTRTGWVSAQHDSLPYWQIDLNRSQQIYRIELLARHDSDQPQHRRNFELRASNDVSFADYAILGGRANKSFPHHGTWRLDVTDGEPYRYLQVRKTVSGEPMGVGEFRVYALPTFRSPQAAHLKLWLDADAGVTKDSQQLVSGWTDQSGNDNDATQPIPASRPLWVRYALNRMPAVRFDGTNDFLSVDKLTGSMKAFTVILVIKPFTFKNWNQVLAATGGWGQFVFHGSSDGTVYAGTSVGSRLVTPAQVYTDHTVQRYSFTMDASGAASLRKNGAAFAQGKLSPSAPWTGFMLGTNASNTLHGDVAELMVYDVALSDAERETVESYLRNKYGY